jgi:peptidoglycan/LPS O-acetylase OafA/YrhL
VGTSVIEERYLASGDEAGTAPGDRRFRPDVEGLRAVAVVLVVLYHANVPRITGGYVGVDVFFVISGFVITGLLLRERAATGHTSILAFYGRRSRRIIPAAVLVIVVTVLLSYHLLGFLTGNSVAVDGRWAAVFLSNFHFEAIGTNYLAALQPPSPLQNYWSLSVEEQFYAVFPMLVVLVARAKARLSFEARLAITLVLVIAGSFGLSVVQTSNDPTAAYFSPFTRAWELALGALIALGTSRLRRLPPLAAAVMTWIGLGAILGASFALDAQSEYPGSLVAIPVLGAGLIIAGGAAAPRLGVEVVLSTVPFRWLGRLSYSLYLWHWPILILAAESRGETSLSAPQSLWWVALAVAASIGSYAIVENPFRHARFLKRTRWASIALGVGLTVVTLGVLTAQIDTHGGIGAAAGTTTSAPAGTVAPATPQTVRRLVVAAVHIRSVPSDLTPSVNAAYFDYGIPDSWTGCSPTYAQTTVPACTFGDPRGTHTVVLYGDSHALMWAQAVNDIAIRAEWKFVLLAKAGCPVDMLPYTNPVGFNVPGGEWTACAQWHQFALDRINRLDPDLVIVTQATHPAPGGQAYAAAQWQRGLEDTLRLMTAPRIRKVVLGNIPYLPQAGPNCLARHLDDVQACSGPNSLSHTSQDQAEQAAARTTGSQYIDLAAWMCGRTCTAVVGNYEVYADRYHLTVTYARVLEDVVNETLRLPVLQQLSPTKPDPHVSLKILSGGSGPHSVVLDAGTTDIVPITKVEIRATGGALRGSTVAVAARSPYGWIAYWDVADVANGRYTVQSVATDMDGKVARSKPVIIAVKN